MHFKNNLSLETTLLLSIPGEQLLQDISPALQQVTTGMRVKVGKVRMPALRSYPWKRRPASSVRQVVAVGLPTVVVPGTSTNYRRLRETGSLVFIDAAVSGANTVIIYQ